MTIHPTSGHIFVGGYDGNFCVQEWHWNEKENSATKIQKYMGHLDFITGLDVLGSSEILVSASEDATVKLWSISEGKCLRTLDCHSSYAFGAAFIFPPPPKNAFSDIQNLLKTNDYTMQQLGEYLRDLSWESFVKEMERIYGGKTDLMADIQLKITCEDGKTVNFEAHRTILGCRSTSVFLTHG